MRTQNLFIDLETKSSADISKTGSYKYAQDKDFEILLFAYAYDDEEVQVVDLASGEQIPQDIIDNLQNPFIMKHAYNAQFEWWCLNQAGYDTPLEQWQCTMVHGLYCGYTAGLEATGKAIGLPEDQQKLKTGRALIRYFCCPRKPTKTDNRPWNLPKHAPEKWDLFKEYNRQDVVTEREIWRRLKLFPVPEIEWHLWRMDVRMNAYGVRVDRNMVRGALKIDALNKEELTEEAKALTGLKNPTAVPQLRMWLIDQGVEVGDSIDKEVVADLIASGVPDHIRRALELRQMLGKTSIAKYKVMEAAAGEDDRIRGVSQFYGANRTGRYSGRLLQLQNCTKNHIDSLDFARKMLADGNYEAIKMIYGDPSDILSQLVRPTLIPSEGRHFVVADFSAIEARVVAYLSGCQWRMDLFAKGGDIYCESASQMFKVPVVKGGINGHLRQKGKIAELALGYGGSTGAMISMGALKMGLKEEELPEIVRLWRAASPEIVRYWWKIDRAVQELMQTNEPQVVGQFVFALEHELFYGQCFMTIKLPSGRKLFYAKPHMAPNRFGKTSLHYFDTNMATHKWQAVETYGPKLVENITQAFARDCLTEVLLRIEKKGWQPVFHVHDEVIVDVPTGARAEDLCELMAEPIPWAPGLILKGAGFENMYYMKD